MSTDLDSLAVECENNMSLAEAGIPVPAVVDLIETTVREANAGALVMSWLPGDAVSAASPPAVQREVGSHLRRIHELGGGPPYHGGKSVHVDWIRGRQGRAAHRAPRAAGGNLVARRYHS